MATDHATKSVTNTFSTTVADTITLDQLWPYVEITNHDGTNNMFASMDGTATPTAALADADNQTVIRPGTTRTLRALPVAGGTTIVVSVVGSGGKYTVEGVQEPVREG